MLNKTQFASVANKIFPNTQIKDVVRLVGGVSAEVHQLNLLLSDGERKSVVVRAHGASYSGHSAELEYKLLKVLHNSGVPVPRPLLVDVSGDLLPDPYLVIEYMEGSSAIPAGHEERYMELMADLLAKIHNTPTLDLPAIPKRIDPLPELLIHLPDDRRWSKLRKYLGLLSETAYAESPVLLHGDFWPENILWNNSSVSAVLDWEDSAIGDPLSDVACCRLELRYKFDKSCVQRFTQAYEKHRFIDHKRLAVWQVYVAAAAHKYMGDWGLPKSLEEHMRKEALSSIQEAENLLTSERTLKA